MIKIDLTTKIYKIMNGLALDEGLRNKLVISLESKQKQYFSYKQIRKDWRVNVLNLMSKEIWDWNKNVKTMKNT